MIKIFKLFLLCICLGSCMEVDRGRDEDFDRQSSEGLFIVNEGNFGNGNASLSYYATDEKTVENEIFVRANSSRMGDSAQSMAIRGNLGYIVVGKSGVVYVIDINTFKIKGLIPGFTNPRYIYLLSDTKAYVTDLSDDRIAVVDPSTFTITGYIDTHGHKSTEQMVQYGKYIFTNCWSNDNTILVIDTETDSVVDGITVGKQPTSLVIDKFDKIWTLTDGGYPGSEYGWEEPALYRIDARNRQIEKIFVFDKNDSPSELCINGERDALYFINNSVWRMNVWDDGLPTEPVIPSRAGMKYYGLGVDPLTSEIYVADAMDYSQPGVIYRFTAGGQLTDRFLVGIIPGAFCFKQ